MTAIKFILHQSITLMAANGTRFSLADRVARAQQEPPNRQTLYLARLGSIASQVAAVEDLETSQWFEPGALIIINYGPVFQSLLLI